MAKLHCALAGFDASDASQIESLAGLIRSHLSAEWSFSTAGMDDCDLLLCDVDTETGAAAWQRSATRGGARAAATFGFLTSGGLTLNKPVQVHGPGSIVHVLNEAAHLGKALAAPSLPAPEPAACGASPAAKPGGLRSMLRNFPTWLSLPAAGPTASPMLHVPPAPASALPVNHKAEPAQRTHDILVPHTPANGRAAGLDLDMPVPRAAAVADLHGPEQQPGPSSSDPVAGDVAFIDAAGPTLLELLRRAKAASQVIVISLRGLPSICAAATIDMCYSYATLQTLFDSPADALAPAHVTVAQNSYYGRNAVQPTQNGHIVSVPAFPLQNLFWVAVLRCGRASEAARYRNGAFKLLAWPDLAGLPHARHHVTWCGLLGRQTMTAAALSAATGHDADEAAMFLAACGELGILKQGELAPEPDAAAPVQSRRASEHATVFRSILKRLGLQWP
ncbi:MAG TPA: hypothetical protein VGC15_10890 [Acetobacteraceae bacterium]